MHGTRLFAVTFGMTSTSQFYFTKVMSDLFVRQSPAMEDVIDMKNIWKFMKEPLLDGLYWEKWYNKQPIVAEQVGFVFYEHRLLGLPRIRFAFIIL